jgi:hypothetical protein
MIVVQIDETETVHLCPRYGVHTTLCGQRSLRVLPYLSLETFLLADDPEIKCQTCRRDAEMAVWRGEAVAAP